MVCIVMVYIVLASVSDLAPTVCIETRADMYTDMCADMCTDMCATIGPFNRRLYRHVRNHVHRQLYRHLQAFVFFTESCTDGWGAKP